MNEINLDIAKELIDNKLELTLSPNTRIIDVTYGELIYALRHDILKELSAKPEPVPALEEGKVHPETGLPEAPEDEVNSDRAREILRSKTFPISVPTLDKYRKKPQWNMTGHNVGGRGLPYKMIGHRAMYKVKDLILLRNNPKAFLK